MLNTPESIKTQGGTPYGVFTAFYNRSVKEPVAKPVLFKKDNFYHKPITIKHDSKDLASMMPKANKNIAVHGGRTECSNIIKHLSEQKNYLKTGDFPAIDTSRLSAHLKFGTYSVREIYHAIQEALGPSHTLIKQLYWRDFFTHVAYHSPFVFGGAYHEQYNKLPWKNDQKLFELWCEGKTGFPIVDAGMRELNATGFMHNRVRMIVASFLIKDLHINWLWGEKYFAQQLVDYDPCVNNGNWQWSASTGCDAQPYFRIFNPWLQQKKFDPDCIYIKQWVPELKNSSADIIHNLFKPKTSIANYPKPIVDHAKESALSKEIYKKVKAANYQS